MYNRIEEILKRYGYEVVALNVADIHLAFREERGEGFAVVTLDETTGTLLGTEQFYHVSAQIREYLQRRGCGYCHFLYLLLSDREDSAKRLFQNRECFWRIVPFRRQVMVYEEMDAGFLVLRRPLEELFEAGERTGSRAWSAGTMNRETRSFSGRRIPWVNLVIILLNVFIFLYTDFFAVFGGEAVKDAGAAGWYPVLKEGEWYRLLTSMFLHSGGQHLLNNMLVLAYMGSCVELELGRLRYGILYIVSGLLAGGTSIVYNMMQNDDTVSVGASGAIFGVVGAMLFLVVFHKGRQTQYSVRQIAWMAFLSLYGGFASQGVDNAAHIGGFIAGFLLAGLLTLLDGQRRVPDSVCKRK